MLSSKLDLVQDSNPIQDGNNNIPESSKCSNETGDWDENCIRQFHESHLAEVSHGNLTNGPQNSWKAETPGYMEQENSLEAVKINFKTQRAEGIKPFPRQTVHLRYPSVEKGDSIKYQGTRKEIDIQDAQSDQKPANSLEKEEKRDEKKEKERKGGKEVEEQFPIVHEKSLSKNNYLKRQLNLERGKPTKRELSETELTESRSITSNDEDSEKRKICRDENYSRKQDRSCGSETAATLEGELEKEHFETLEDIVEADDKEDSERQGYGNANGKVLKREHISAIDYLKTKGSGLKEDYPRIRENTSEAHYPRRQKQSRERVYDRGRRESREKKHSRKRYSSEETEYRKEPEDTQERGNCGRCEDSRGKRYTRELEDSRGREYRRKHDEARKRDCGRLREDSQEIKLHEEGKEGRDTDRFKRRKNSWERGPRRERKESREKEHYRRRPESREKERHRRPESREKERYRRPEAREKEHYRQPEPREKERHRWPASREKERHRRLESREKERHKRLGSREKERHRRLESREKRDYRRTHGSDSRGRYKEEIDSPARVKSGGERRSQGRTDMIVESYIDERKERGYDKRSFNRRGGERQSSTDPRSKHNSYERTSKGKKSRSNDFYRKESRDFEQNSVVDRRDKEDRLSIQVSNYRRKSAKDVSHSISSRKKRNTSYQEVEVDKRPKRELSSHGNESFQRTEKKFYHKYGVNPPSEKYPSYDYNRNNRRQRTSSTESSQSSSSSTTNDSNNEDENLTEEQLMAKLVGVSNFNSSKGKNHSNSDLSGANKKTKRRYRQYMNRRGGFNRPLSPVF